MYLRCPDVPCVLAVLATETSDDTSEKRILGVSQSISLLLFQTGSSHRTRKNVHRWHPVDWLNVNVMEQAVIEKAVSFKSLSWLRPLLHLQFPRGPKADQAKTCEVSDSH